MMASMVILALLSLNALFQTRAAPLDVASVQDATTAVVVVTAIITSNVEVLETSTILLPSPPPLPTTSAPEVPVPPSSQPPETPSPLPVPSQSSAPPDPSSEPSQPSQPPQSPLSSTVPTSLPLPPPPISAPPPPPPPSATTIIEVVTVIDTITPAPVTVTLVDPPTTTTQTVTVSPSATSTNSSLATSWAASPQMTDLSCFKVSDFAYGKDNMQIIQGIPANASATTAATFAVASAAPDLMNSTTSATPDAANSTSSATSYAGNPTAAVTPDVGNSTASATTSTGNPMVTATPDAGNSTTPGTGNSTAATTPYGGNSTAPALPTWDNSSSVLQLFYPAGSVNPTSKPQGGADFYASPLDLSHAQNVSLSYSVFFPVDFDWVLAGKLPGIYGGHRTCSGGDDALSCFSTRLMWREGGAGELYLYAPKDKQTDDLCNTPPKSVCDQEYGLSIGRGAFNFTPGAWTYVKQTVTLNTPGAQDGSFMLEINGQLVMNRTDVYYRGVTSASPSSHDGDSDDGGDPDDPDYATSTSSSDGGPSTTITYISPTASPTAAPPTTPVPAAPAPEDPGLDGILGPILGPLRSLSAKFGWRRFLTFTDITPDDSGATNASTEDVSVATSSESAGFVDTMPPASSSTTSDSTSTTVIPVTQTVWTQTTVTSTAYMAQPTVDSQGVQVLAQTPKPIGFTGLFFSTFFGGHEEQYATPKDQYTWFKDFAMVINA